MPSDTSPAPPALSPAMQALSEAIRARSDKARAVFCGFDLWLEVLGSGHTSTLDFRAGGIPADGTEDEYTVVVPVVVIGKRIVVSFDPTLPADAFELR